MFRSIHNNYSLTQLYWCRIHLWFRLMGGLQAKSMTSQCYRAVTRWRMCYYGNVMTTRWWLCVTMETFLHLQQYSHRFYTWRHVSAAHTAIFRPAYNRTGPFMCAQYGIPHCLHIKYMWNKYICKTYDYMWLIIGFTDIFILHVLCM